MSWACRSEKEQLAEWSKDKAVRGREGQTEEAEGKRRSAERGGGGGGSGRRRELWELGGRHFRGASPRRSEAQNGSGSWALGSIRFAPQSRARGNCVSLRHEVSRSVHAGRAEDILEELDELHRRHRSLPGIGPALQKAYGCEISRKKVHGVQLTARMATRAPR